MKKGIILLTVLLLLLYPFSIFAEDATYYFFESTETPIYRTTGNYPTTCYLDIYGNTSEVRLVNISTPSVYSYAVSLNNFSIKKRTPRDNGSFGNWSTLNTASYTYQGTTIYYICFLGGGGTSYNYYDNPLVTDLVSLPSGINSNIFSQADFNAYYYTFGGGASGPSVALVYGDLANLGFYTKFTNSQQSNISQMALNKDVITWDKYQDTAGNDLNDINLRVDIQAAIVDYEANTKSDLLNQTINDMVTGAWSDLITISPNVGTYETTWQNVASALWGTNNITINFWNSLFNVFDSAQGVFYKNGWIYRIRLRTEDNSYIISAP